MVEGALYAGFSGILSIANLEYHQKQSANEVTAYNQVFYLESWCLRRHYARDARDKVLIGALGYMPASISLRHGRI